MQQRSEFEVISGDAKGLGGQLALLSGMGWKPILITSTSVSVPSQATGNVVITLVLERLLGA